MSHSLHSTEPNKKAGALLAAVITPDLTPEEADASFSELARLCETLGYAVHGRTHQKKENYKSPAVFGGGKLKEIAQEISELHGAVNVVVFDRELSPLQGRNVEQAINAELVVLGADYTIHVYDRTAIIIEIFFKHAKSRQSKLQIEIAKLKYGSPRLREELERNGDRQGGGIGGKGAGETKSELKGRQLRDRLAQLRAELENLREENDQRRERREVQSIALVGYTNSGKSSLMRSLTLSEIYVADRLFATLDVTTRQLQPPVTPPILITDTIGFVRFLPHDLLASFKSTLAEANNADLLLHVVDAGDPQFLEHIKTTNSVLKELGAEEHIQQMVFNKIDQVNAESLAILKSQFPQAWFTSALDRERVNELHDRLIKHFESLQRIVRAFVPFSQGRVLGEIRKVASVLRETFLPEGTEMYLQIKPLDLARMRSHHPTIDFDETSALPRSES